MNLRKHILVPGLVALGTLLAGCGGGSGNAPSGISVAIANAPGSMVVKASASITAVVSNEGTSAGVTWTITCGSSACGSISPASGPGNNPNTTYIQLRRPFLQEPM